MELRPGYKQSELGVIPEGWEVVSIGSLASFTSGSGISVAALHRQSSDTPVPVFGGNGIAGYTTRPLVGQPVVVVGRVGQKCGEVYLTEGPAWITDNALYPRTTFRPLIVPFLALAMKAAGLNNVKNRNDLPLVTQSILHAVRIAWPPDIGEQRAITGALSDVDAVIGALDKLIAKKRDIKQAAMQQLLTGKQRLSGFGGKWEEKRLGDVLEKIVGGGTPSRSNPNYWGNEIPWVTVKDFATFNPCQAQEMITMVGLQNSASHLVPKGTLITSTRMALGKAVIYQIDVSINQDLKALFPKPNLSPQYLYFWFQYRGKAIDALSGGSTVKGISLPDLKGIEFHLPSLPEQTAIASAISDMDAEIAALEQRRDKTRTLKQGMMQELLMGKTRLV